MRTILISSPSFTASAINTWGERRMALKAFVVGSALSALAAMPQAHAGILTLTPQGVADGFTLSQFAFLNPGFENSFNLGPFGVAYAGNGKVIVSRTNDRFSSQHNRWGWHVHNRNGLARWCRIWG